MDAHPIRLYTIGHSNHLLDKFVRLLLDKSVKVLVDVRSAPYSKYSPQYNQNELSVQLPKVEIRYIYAGKELGGRPIDPTCYKSHQIREADTDYLHEVNYPEVMKRDWFQQGIADLLKLSAEAITCIMCSEEDPAHCHRHHLITKYLVENYPQVEILHIRGDGNLVKPSHIRANVDEATSDQLPLF